MRFVREVKPLPDFHLHLLFDDGKAGIVRFDPWKRGRIFEPLREVAEFQAAYVDDYGAVAWPCGTDLDPDTLYELLATSGQAAVNS